MAKRTRTFKTEVRQLLDLVVHSLYSKKEIFLRELISNASDAIDRARFEALTNPGAARDDDAWRIRVTIDRAARTLTIADNGIGMTGREVEEHIGTIANSGTKRFLEALRESGGSAGPEFIGQFGVGFYAAFMVADQVTLVTRRAGSDEPGVRWTSAGDGGRYTLEEGVEVPESGTSVTLRLREGLDEFLDRERLRGIIKDYSDFIAFPIVLAGEGAKEGEDEPVNSMKAIWRRAPAEVPAEDYDQFYRHVSHQGDRPLKTIHFTAEGVTEFRALLYLPGEAPFDLYFPGPRRGLQLYVRNVFITDDNRELLPDFLRFVRGVVDASDLPLNVSREMLQDHASLRRIRRGLVSKLLNTLAEMKDKEADSYRAFYERFGQVLKEGLHGEPEYRDKLQELVLFHSSRTGAQEWISLADYVGRMPAEQPAIYFLTAPGFAAADTSPHLELFRRKDIEVLLLTDPIDEWVVLALETYQGKPLRAADRGEPDAFVSGEQPEEKDGGGGEERWAGLLTAMREQLADQVKDVRLSRRLTDSACCLVTDPHEPNAHMERILRAMHKEMPPTRRILELNPTHPLADRLLALHANPSAAGALAERIELLYDQALLVDGSPVRDPVQFARRLSGLMAASSSGPVPEQPQGDQKP